MKKNISVFFSIYNNIVSNMKNFVFFSVIIPILLSAQWLEMTIYVPDSLCGMTHPQAFAYNATNNKIYVGGHSGNCVIIIDGTTNQKIARVSTGSNINALCWNSQNNKVYCANWDSNDITVIDGQTNSVITTITAGSGPNALVWNAQNNNVYCANYNSANVTVIDGQTNSVIATITVGNGPNALVWNSQNNKVYCVNDATNNVTVIDGQTNSVITTITVGYWPCTLVWNATNNKVYCANQYNDNVTVIDGQTDSVITTIAVGTYPCAFCWNAIQNRVYVANNQSSNISVIRDSIISGIEENRGPLSADRLSYEVYPNPAKLFFVVRFPSSIESQVLKMFDVSGKLVKEIDSPLAHNDQVAEMRVSLKGISPGIYFLQLNNELETKKLVITK